MKSKQLANVLIKIIGLYICLCAIPGIVSGILYAIVAIFPTKMDEPLLRMFYYSIGDAVQVIVGIFLICKSQKLAAFWFKNEDE